MAVHKSEMMDFNTLRNIAVDFRVKKVGFEWRIRTALVQCIPNILMTHRSFSVILSSHLGNLSQVRLNLHRS